jgi:Co/Zn/Cd efflux system component
MFEQKSEPLLSRGEFLGRVARSALTGALLVVGSLAIGMAGYHRFERLSWLDAFLNAAMLLGGMGPVAVPMTEGGKLFAGLYALYCGLMVIAVAGIVLAPVAHRILHRFHLEERDE